MNCARCNRKLKVPAPSGYGPKCAAAVLGLKPARARRAAVPNERQADLFKEVLP